MGALALIMSVDSIGLCFLIEAVCRDVRPAAGALAATKGKLTTAANITDAGLSTALSTKPDLLPFQFPLHGLCLIVENEG